MLKSKNFANVMTSELLLTQESEVEQEKCKNELNRRLKSIGFTEKQIEQFVCNEQEVITAYKSDTLSEKFMAETEFFTCPFSYEIEIKELTISEMLLATEEATNEYPRAKGGEGGFEYFNVVSEYARQLIAKGYHTAIEKLKAMGLEEDSIKKFIFAEWQVIRKVTFHDEEAFDAWGNPEKFLS